MLKNTTREKSESFQTIETLDYISDNWEQQSQHSQRPLNKEKQGQHSQFLRCFLFKWWCFQVKLYLSIFIVFPENDFIVFTENEFGWIIGSTNIHSLFREWEEGLGISTVHCLRRGKFSSSSSLIFSSASASAPSLSLIFSSASAPSLSGQVQTRVPLLRFYSVFPI